MFIFLKLTNVNTILLFPKERQLTIMCSLTFTNFPIWTIFRKAFSQAGDSEMFLSLMLSISLYRIWFANFVHIKFKVLRLFGILDFLCCIVLVYFRQFEELKSYSNEMQNVIGNLLKVRAVSLYVFYDDDKHPRALTFTGTFPQLFHMLLSYPCNSLHGLTSFSM